MEKTQFADIKYMQLKTNEVRRLRLTKDYKQDYMADILGIEQSQYSRIEKGECAVDFDKVLKIAQILDVNWFDIVDGINSQNFYNCKQAGHNNIMNNYQNFENERKAYLAQMEDLKTQISELKRDKEDLRNKIKLLKEVKK
ncbi:MAG: helix-turn-helix domain-containing protein [Prevotellaceae bacterium]|jgi:transcriptional regulator with XRE-family HTH domain|nr:helix-turn-helix domain-containing protein [Prevotellaceae bacterium]